MIEHIYPSKPTPYERGGQVVKELDPYPMLCQNAGKMSVRAFGVRTIDDVNNLSQELRVLASSCQPPYNPDNNEIEISHQSPNNPKGWTKLSVYLPIGTVAPEDVDLILPPGLSIKEHNKLQARFNTSNI